MTNVKETNVYKLFNIKLPAIEHFDIDGDLMQVDYYVDISDDVRLIFEWETESLLINGKYVGKITPGIAGELINIVNKLGYTESH